MRPLKAIAIVAITATPAYSQARNVCAARPVVIERLQSVYGETRQSIAMGGNGSVFETWANNDTGSWTLTVTMPNGMMCLATSGQSFERLAEALPPKGTVNRKRRR
jgi:hypothetical protein